MKLLEPIKRYYIWIRRFRKRRGYGVHSPFAFDLMMNVIHEKRSYYAYKDIENYLRLRKSALSKKQIHRGRRKVNRLLFRLSNRMQPLHIYNIGHPSVSSYYLQAGCVKANYHNHVSLTDFTDLPSIDLLYLNSLHKSSEEIFQTFMKALPYATERSLFIIDGIYKSHEMRSIWKQMQEDERVGITFDLYDLGLLFFDRKRFKQHYIVNF